MKFEKKNYHCIVITALTSSVDYDNPLIEIKVVGFVFELTGKWYS